MHIMDGFHFERDLKGIANPFQGRSVRKRVHEALEKDDRRRADGIVRSLMELSENEAAEIV